jgi:hypothetical protein
MYAACSRVVPFYFYLFVPGSAVMVKHLHGDFVGFMFFEAAPGHMQFLYALMY